MGLVFAASDNFRAYSGSRGQPSHSRKFVQGPAGGRSRTLVGLILHSAPHAPWSAGIYAERRMDRSTIRARPARGTLRKGDTRGAFVGRHAPAARRNTADPCARPSLAGIRGVHPAPGAGGDTALILAG